MARRSGPRWSLGLWLILTIGMGLAFGLTVGIGTLWTGWSVAVAEIYLLVAGLVWIAVAGIGWILVRRVDQVLERHWLDIVAWINQLDEGR